MLTPAEAARLVEEALPPPRQEEVPLAEAVGRVLAVDVVAEEDVPAFDRAAMDGYALRTGDLAGGRGPATAAGGGAVTLLVVGAARAGHPFAGTVEPGTAVAIATGAPLPAGSDAVVRWEDTRPADGGTGFVSPGGRVEIRVPPRPGQNVSPRGEDVRTGAVVLRAGTRLGPAAVGVLAALGRARVRVLARPGVAVLPTGDEVVAVERRPGPGQVRNSTAWALAAAAAEAGAAPVVLEPVPDEREALTAALERCGERELVFTTGGVSVGQHDLLGAAARRAGYRVLFRRLAMRPGKNILLAERDGRLLVGLSGNPAACLLSFDVVVRPALVRLAGDPGLAPVPVRAVLARPARRLPGFSHCLRVRYLPPAAPGGAPLAEPVGSQLGTVLSSLVAADGYALLPPGEGEAPAGMEVAGHLLPARAPALLGGWLGP